jgi:hypothetical protein
MKALKIASIVAFVSATTGSAAFAEVQLTLQNGRVSIVAKDATVRQILAEWARVGQTQILNVDKIPGAPLTLELTNVPEAEALDVLLRSISGYMAAPRAVMATNVSQFDRIVVMPTTAAPRPPVSASAAPPSPMQQPQFQQPFPQQAVDDDADDERPAPNAAMPQRGPVFNQFPQPQIVSPQVAPTVVGGAPTVVGGAPAIPSGVFNPQQPQMAQPQFGQHPPGLEIAPQPATGAMPIYQVPPNGQPPAGAAPTGVAIPGMIVPAPQQPGATTITGPQPPRRPGGEDEDR